MSFDLAAVFEQRFRTKPAVCASAPGRLEILGNHTDYNEGFVLSAAVGQTTNVALSPVDGDICTIHEKGQDCTIDLREIDVPVKGDWRNYWKGLLVELRRKGIAFGAFNACLSSSVPLAAGMSSSAALEMAFAYALKTVFHIELSLPDWARVGQAVENKYLGLKSGLLDQFSSLYGKKNSLIMCDFRSVEVLKNVPMPAGWTLVVANTMVKHNLVDSAYNKRRASCENALNAVQRKYPDVKALRDVSMDMLVSCKSLMAEEDYKRALHVVGEDERVMQGVKFLENDDIRSFGSLLFASHESSRVNFENSCPELDVLVDIAHTMPACVGARLSGGGFGGISIHLVESDKQQEYCSALKSAYFKKTGKNIDTILCSIGDGARVIEQ